MRTKQRVNESHNRKFGKGQSYRVSQAMAMDLTFTLNVLKTVRDFSMEERYEAALNFLMTPRILV